MANQQIHMDGEIITNEHMSGEIITNQQMSGEVITNQQISGTSITEEQMDDESFRQLISNQQAGEINCFYRCILPPHDCGIISSGCYMKHFRLSEC